MNEKINKHCNYSAQHWIDEYERLTGDGWNIDGGMKGVPTPQLYESQPTATMVENILQKKNRLDSGTGENNEDIQKT